MTKCMSILTYCLTSLAVLIVGLVVVISRRPDTFLIERSATMAAPALNPFAQVNDFHNWKSWSPYVEGNPETTKPCAFSESRHA